MAGEGGFPQGFVTIKSLIAKSGAPRQTIHYYLRKGLLPTPERTSRTSALYPPNTIDLIGLVRSLQRRQRLTLDEISTLFHQGGYDPVRIAARVSGGGDAPPTSGARRDSLTAVELATAIGAPCSEEWVKSLVKEGLVRHIWREDREVFPANIVETARAIWDGTRLGLTLDSFRTWNALAESQAEKETAPLQRSLAGIPPSPPARVAALFDVFERFGRARRKTLLSAHFARSSAQHQALFVGPDQKYLFPSETLLERMGLNREIDRLVRALDRNRDDIESLKQLSRAYNLRSDWVHLKQVAREVLRLEPDNVRALSDMAQALRYQGRPAEAVGLLEQVLKRQSHPLLKVRLARALVSQARDAEDVRQLVEALEEYERLTGEALRESQGDRGLHRRIRLILVLEAMSMQGPLGMRHPTAGELERLYDEYMEIKVSRLPALSRISTVRGRIFLAYALYVLRAQEGDPQAERLRRELVKADPHGVLAARVEKARGRTKASTKASKRPPKKQRRRS